MASRCRCWTESLPLLFLLVLLTLAWSQAAAAATNGSSSSGTNNNNNNTTTTDYDYDYDVYENNPQYALLYPWIVQVLGVVFFFILKRYEIPLPYAAIMFVVGMFMGIAAKRLNGNMTQLHTSIRQWGDIDSQVLLLAFLPGLIFRDAMDINVYTFRKCLSQLLILAFPMVLMGTGLTATVCFYMLPISTDISWSLGLTVGSILASTDPVAVAAVLKQADAPPRLQMHIGGESLLNDGAAVVFYTIFAQQFLADLGLPSGNTVTVAQGFVTFIRMALGGFTVGLAFAICLLVFLYELDRRLDKENNVLQVAAAVSTAYLSYYVSEQVCQMSGVISCVTCGVVTKAFGNGMIADPELMDSYLILLEHLLNTLLFTLGGTVFGEVIANSDARTNFTALDWLSLFILYVMIMIIRVLQVVVFYPALKYFGLSTNWKEMAFFSWAGLRGAVGIALALALDATVRQESDDEAQRALTNTVMGLAGGVSFLTLMVNGSMAGWLLRRLGLTPPVTSRRQVIQLFHHSARDFVLLAYVKLRNDQPRFANVDFHYVLDHVPFLQGVTKESMTKMMFLQRNNNYRGSTLSNAQYFSNDDSLPYVDSRTSSLVLTASQQQQRKRKTGSTGKKQHRRGNSRLDALEDMEATRTEHIRGTTVRELYTYSDKNIDKDFETCKQQVREIFLKILDAAYQIEATTGELDWRDDIIIIGHNNYEALRQSVAFAVEDCHAGQEPLHDWSQAQNFDNNNNNNNMFHDRLDDFALRLWDFFQKRVLRRGYSSPLEYQQKRTRILRALEFIEAHGRAEEELHTFLDRGDDDFQTDGTNMNDNKNNNNNHNKDSSRPDVENATPATVDTPAAASAGAGGSGEAAKEGVTSEDLEDAILIVLEESRVQVQQAELFVQTAVTPDELEMITSHIMVSILLQKLALYVEKSVKDGRLKEVEGRNFLKQIQQSAEKAKHCHSIHEGNTRRERRKKQKSTGSTSSSIESASFWGRTNHSTSSNQQKQQQQQKTDNDQEPNQQGEEEQQPSKRGPRRRIRQSSTGMTGGLPF